MKFKAFFIIIITLLAALFGAAQEVIVVYEGATTNHSVENNPGSSFAWGVYTNFSPNIEAPPEDYKIAGTANANKIQLKWLNTGIYYLKVSETDLKGCQNTKAISVSVISNTRTVGFLTTSGYSCFNSTTNGFNIPLVTSDSNGQPITEDYFPLVVEFIINGKGYSQDVPHNNQILIIPDDWINANPNTNFSARIEITAARDAFSDDIVPEANMETYTRTIMALPQTEFESVETSFLQGSQFDHKVKMIAGNPENSIYHWSLSPETGTTTNLGLINGPTASILWNGPPGYYNLQVTVTDGNGCTGESSNQQILITETSGFTVDAGRDTTTGSCNAYQLLAKIDNQQGETFKYQWRPATNLDNPNIQNPVFTPGNSTTFIVSVTNSKGISEYDTVKINVSGITADAGSNIYMEQNSSTILNGSASSGSGIQYNWFTVAGKIESGANTPNPVVSGFGAYYLEITDKFGCIATDSVSVYRLAHAPVASDDYDTTRYLTEVKIPVLDNDTDQENSIVPSTLTISLPPFNGTAYVDFDDYTIHYRPNESFSGTDHFEYQICNTLNECDKANVFVLVTDFKFLIPNAFSPNGDGINDYFEIKGIEYYEGNSIIIVNRWGNKVYEAKDYGINTIPVFWNGKANTGVRVGSEELPTGTYYYILELGNGEASIGGSVYLDR